MTLLALRRLAAKVALAAAALGAPLAQGQQAPSIVVIGGASHAPHGFADERVQRFYVAGSAAPGYRTTTLERRYARSFVVPLTESVTQPGGLPDHSAAVVADILREGVLNKTKGTP